MITNLQPHTIYAVHLRAASATGGKDWVGSITSQGEIHIYWGRTGQIVQHAAKPGDVNALQKLISQKKQGKDHYQQIDEYDQQNGWQSQRRQPPPPQREPLHSDPVPPVEWEEAPKSAIKWDF